MSTQALHRVSVEDKVETPARDTQETRVWMVLGGLFTGMVVGLAVWGFLEHFVWG